MPLHELLLELSQSPTVKWLFLGVAVAVSIVLEKLVLERETCTCPAGFDTAVGYRQDPDLEEMMALGGAASSSERATFPEQHARSYLLLRRPRKGKKEKQVGLHLARTRQVQLVRYQDVSQLWFQNSHHFLVLTDASRIGNKEYALFCLACLGPDGKEHFCWAPPQVSASPSRQSDVFLCFPMWSRVFRTFLKQVPTKRFRTFLRWVSNLSQMVFEPFSDKWFYDEAAISNLSQKGFEPFSDGFRTFFREPCFSDFRAPRKRLW